MKSCTTLLASSTFSFFVSSRRRLTRFDCDWSSDVCASDLRPGQSGGFGPGRRGRGTGVAGRGAAVMPEFTDLLAAASRLADRGGRRILGITGAPGAGKSTLAGRLVAALGDRAVEIGMDGFHLAQR